MVASEAGDMKIIEGLISEDMAFAGLVPQPIGMREVEDDKIMAKAHICGTPRVLPNNRNHMTRLDEFRQKCFHRVVWQRVQFEPTSRFN
jgi:hypothetical protein